MKNKLTGTLDGVFSSLVKYAEGQKSKAPSASGVVGAVR
jgi:hypothetical protein